MSFTWLATLPGSATRPPAGYPDEFDVGVYREVVGAEVAHLLRVGVLQAVLLASAVGTCTALLRRVRR